MSAFIKKVVISSAIGSAALFGSTIHVHATEPETNEIISTITENPKLADMWENTAYNPMNEDDGDRVLDLLEAFHIRGTLCYDRSENEYEMHYDDVSQEFVVDFLKNADAVPMKDYRNPASEEKEEATGNLPPHLVQKQSIFAKLGRRTSRP